MDLRTVIADIADALKLIDSSSPAFRTYLPGVGPYGEPQLLKLVCQHLNTFHRYGFGVKTMRTPDLLIKGQWALEVKIVRPFGNDGKLGRKLVRNLLHPYPGNTSLLGNCLKLRSLECEERRAVLAITYAHDPPQIDLEPLVGSFELIAAQILTIGLGERITAERTGPIHPINRRLTVMGCGEDTRTEDTAKLI